MSGSATSTYSSPVVVFFQPWSTTKCPPPPVQPILAPSGLPEAIRSVKSGKLTTPLRTSNKLEVAFRALSRYQGTSQAETVPFVQQSSPPGSVLVQREWDRPPRSLS